MKGLRGRPPAVVPPPPAADDDVVELCAFQVGGAEYVIDLRRLREILQPLPITPVPRAPEYVEGVVDLRGEVIPVVDARKRLGVPERTGGRPKVLVLQLAGRVLGLVVDAVTGVVRLPRSAIGPPPPLLDGGGPRLFLGVCGAGGARPGAGPAAAARGGPAKLRLLLNVKALLQAPAGALAEARARTERQAP